MKAVMMTNRSVLPSDPREPASNTMWLQSHGRAGALIACIAK